MAYDQAVDQQNGDGHGTLGMGARRGCCRCCRPEPDTREFGLTSCQRCRTSDVTVTEPSSRGLVRSGGDDPTVSDHGRRVSAVRRITDTGRRGSSSVPRGCLTRALDPPRGRESCRHPRSWTGCAMTMTRRSLAASPRRLASVASSTFTLRSAPPPPSPPGSGGSGWRATSCRPRSSDMEQPRLMT